MLYKMSNSDGIFLHLEVFGDAGSRVVVEESIHDEVYANSTFQKCASF